MFRDCFSSSRRDHKRSVFLAGLVAATLSSAPAFADVTDELLEQLRAKGVLTKGEFHKLKARHAAEVQQKEQQKYAAPPGRKVVTKEGVIVVPDDRYVTRLDKGIGVRIGEVDVKLSGDLSFFATNGFKTQGDAVVAGGIAGAASGSHVNNASSIQAGLLPSALVVSLATHQMGYDLGFTLGLYTSGTNTHPGTFNANDAGSAVALGTPGIDLRQVFGTIGTPDFGTVKIGRDLGLFGADAILFDQTLLGSGSLLATASPHNTTFGRIGVGYVYADWIPQVTYISPEFYGFTFSIGAFSPYQQFNSTGLSGTMTAHDQPGFQARLKYVGQLTPDLKLTAWVDGLTQQHRTEVGDAVFLTPGTNIRTSAVDGGLKFDLGALSLVGYGYYGSGLGTTGLYYDGISIDGQKRNSSGFYGQAAYTFDGRFTVGGSYGASYLDANWIDYQPGFGNGTLVHSNSSWIGFGRYKLTDWVNIQGEYIHTISRNALGGSLSSDAFVIGTTFFF
ncbi:conserved hypothetical protein [Beijerinckia indica subsp. indica ATCC 9039]|uniref:Porin domain-containing protein n=1 Tax=Beijerinckia indica subsp. indica (strain ATCC 9039 / DSM 1715 / NCIMB 8712) TaxID=395963 RepID=B2IGW7_BEII9|nr:conserved hypothetical protein [Beijerinckia indica subsp. indica ATCC 9039]